MTFSPLSEAFIRRTWYSVLPVLDTTGRRRVKKAVVCVAQLAAIITILLCLSVCLSVRLSVASAATKGVLYVSWLSNTSFPPVKVKFMIVAGAYLLVASVSAPNLFIMGLQRCTFCRYVSIIPSRRHFTVSHSTSPDRTTLPAQHFRSSGLLCRWSDGLELVENQKFLFPNVGRESPKTPFNSHFLEKV